MNWALLFMAFALAVVMGMGFAALLLQMRPHWSSRKRTLIAASCLPAVVIALTLVGLVVVMRTGPGSGENMQDLAITATATIGGFFAVLGFLGGLVGASIAERKRRR
jgi:hypothetical protein